MVTIKDIGRAIGVSHATVSRALNGSPLVKPDTRALVLETARSMGYRPDSAARMLRGSTANIIGFVLPDITNAFYSRIASVVGRFNIVRPEVMISVPVGVTGVEQRAVRDAAEAAGARRPAHLIPEPLAAAIGAEIPVGSARGHMVIDIGGGRSEAAVISMFGIVASESVRIAGDRLDDAIAQYIKRRHNLVVGERTAEEVKRAIGSAVPLDEELTAGVRGRDQITGLPRTVTIRSSEITQAIQDHLVTIVQTARRVLERTPPELASDVIDHGIVLTGGGALLRGIDELILHETGVPVHIADDPLRCVARGAGMALDYIEVIERSLPTEEETMITEAAR